MSSNTLLISVQTMKDRSILHSNVDEKFVKPDIKYCQDAFMLPILGSALMAKIQTLIDTNALAGVYLTLRDDYITDALMYSVLAECPTTLTYHLYNKGLIRKTSDNTDNPDIQVVNDIVNKYQARAEFYGQKLINYLIQNHTLFPEYDQPGSGIDTVIPEKGAYQSTFYLGDDCNCSDGSFLPVSDSKFKRGCK